MKLIGGDKVTGVGRVTGIEGAQYSVLQYGEPVEESGGDKALHHDHNHLRAGQLLLRQPPCPAGNPLTALLSSYQGSHDVKNPIKKESWVTFISSQ